MRSDAVQARRAVWASLRLLPGVSRRLSLALAGCMAIEAVLPALFAVASGVLVGSVVEAVGGGFGTAAGRRLLWALAATAVSSRSSRWSVRW